MNGDRLLVPASAFSVSFMKPDAALRPPVLLTTSMQVTLPTLISVASLALQCSLISVRDSGEHQTGVLNTA
jgi:hypothetical protein